ncbi:sulfite exporter TauE/SafE family protein [Peribacillus alkalitolerans]|uniref:sulfite exporter TauE/SafE family protein n=1 Tax=Peribacillus alkalitolerans TaxID=1550385 RepID=UPI0013CF747D|nr:sulfite exporter TauE/SafE family protein [Peribacillus alkalitolerans]
MTAMLLIFLGFIVAFIGTLAGSGGLIGMPSLMLLGVPVHSAIATAKFSNMISSFSSFYVLLKKKELKLKEAIKLIPIALLGGLTGGLLATSISDKTMSLIAVFLLSGAFILSFIKKPKQDGVDGWSPSPKTYPFLYGISTYDGMFGPGQATMLMYTFIWNGASYIQAIAYTRFQTFLSCFAAFFPFWLNGDIKWHVAIYFALGSLIGAQTAVRLAPKIPTKYLKWLLNVVTVCLILQLLWKVLSFR